MRHSYSSVECYYSCPAKYKYRYRDGLHLPRPASAAADRGSLVHKSFELCLLDEEYKLIPPFDYYYEFLGTLRERGAVAEKEIVLTRNWTVPLPWEDAWLKAILDIELIDAPTARNYDWKTGKIYPEHADQRELYSLIQMCIYPVEAAIGMHVYVDLKENRVSEFTRADIPHLKTKWEEKIRQLEEDEIFPTNPSFRCRSCEYSRWNGGPCKF